VAIPQSAQRRARVETFDQVTGLRRAETDEREQVRASSTIRIFAQVRPLAARR
jgi:hypothetical protein